MHTSMSRQQIKKQLTTKLGYKAPEQLANIMGEIGEISVCGEVTIEEKWWPKEGYLVGRLRGGGNGLNRIAILWSDGSLDTFG